LIEHVFLAHVVRRIVLGVGVFIIETVNSLEVVRASLIALFSVSANLSNVLIVFVVLVLASIRETLSRGHVATFDCAWVVDAVHEAH